MPLEIPHLAGVMLALAAATFFAGQHLLVRLGTEHGHVTDVVLITLVTNVVIVVPLTLVVHGIPPLTRQAVLWFALAGIFGSMLARLFMFKSVQVIGASRTAPVLAANVFFATVLAIAVFGEHLTPWHGLGIVLIVSGVAAVSWETARGSEPDQSYRELGISLILPLVAAVLLGFEPIFVTLGLEEGVAILPGVGIKATAATMGYVSYLLLVGRFDPGLFTWSSQMRWYVGAGLTSTLGIVSLFAGLAAAPVVLVIPLLQTTPLIVMGLSVLLMPRRLEIVTWRLVSASVVVVVGASIVAIH